MESRGGETGGPTMDDFLDEFRRRGFRGDVSILESGDLQCMTCGGTADPERFTLVSLRRVEGVSDPADMMAVSAIECPYCGARGTSSFCYGPQCPPGHAEALRRMRDLRPSHLQSVSAETDDDSLVSDTGWLRHADKE